MINWNVRNRKDFINLLAALAEDYRENRGDWESQDLETFLSQIADYARDREAYLEQHGQEMTDWHFISKVFQAAREYE
ncbi:MAG: hypothetical protein AMXMBFR33_37870 [Candidatus Xenobia bacterium]